MTDVYAEFLQTRKEHEERVAQYHKLVEEKGKLVLAHSFQQMFSICPELKKIVWNQYTPYFNDGEECVFHVYTRYFFIENSECDEEEEEYEWAEPTAHINDHFEKWWRGKWGSVSNDVILRLYAMNQTLGSMKEVFKETFGDHVKVCAVVDAAGNVTFEVEEYSHD